MIVPTVAPGAFIAGDYALLEGEQWAAVEGLALDHKGTERPALTLTREKRKSERRHAYKAPPECSLMRAYNREPWRGMRPGSWRCYQVDVDDVVRVHVMLSDVPQFVASKGWRDEGRENLSRVLPAA